MQEAFTKTWVLNPSNSMGLKKILALENAT